MAKAAAKEIPVAVAQTPSAEATIEFTPGQEIETGDITQNSAFSIIYDPARLPNIRNYHNGMPAWDITANLRFHPGLESYNGSVVQKTDTTNGNIRVLSPPRPLPLSVQVPTDAMGLEIWFLNSGMYGDKAWDSRYGQNYWFPVAQAGPAQPVSFRTGALRDPSMVNVVNWTATKVDIPIGASSEGSQLETQLSLTAWVKNIQYQKNVWVDFHVFDGDENLVHSETVPLSYYQPGGGGGDLFILDQRVLKGSGGIPGFVWPRPDARLLEFRLYYEVGDNLFTDGYLHQSKLPADAAVSMGLAIAA